MRAFALLIAVTSCSAPARPPATVEGQRWTVRYDAHHRGDHPDTDFTITQQIEIGAVVRSAYVAVYNGEEFARGSVEVRRDGTPVRMVETPAGEPAIEVTYRPHEATYRRGEREIVLRADKLAGDPAAFELALVAGGIEPGEQREVDLVDVEREAVRRFQIVADPEIQLATPTGDVCAVPVRLLAVDGDARLAGTIHLRCDAPHVVLRRDYVVFPETAATDTVRATGHRRSSAIEELVELRGP